MRSRPVLAVLCAAVALFIGARAEAGGDWNDNQIKWQAYEEGLEQAKKSQRPVCLIFYTEWCPHCTNYSKVFHDPKVVEKSKEFVMIRLDADQNKQLGPKYAVDGSYIPRTFFLSPAGVLDPDIHVPREQYKYFYDERRPDSILAGMDQALKKYR
ncbi:MAG: thioredoxin family protein [Candidatus Binatia bacterium]